MQVHLLAELLRMVDLDQQLAVTESATLNHLAEM